MREFFRRKGITVNDLKSKVSVIIVTETAEENAAEVSGPHKAVEFKVAEMKSAVRGKGGGRLNGRPIRVVFAVGTAVEIGDFGGGIICSRGRGKTVVEAECKAATSQTASCTKSTISCGGSNGSTTCET